MALIARRALMAVAAMLSLGAGCTPKDITPDIVAVQEPWSNQGKPGARITTDHFDLYTTIEDAQLRDYLPSFLEATYRLYAELVPAASENAERLQTYLFSHKFEWLSFTKRTFPERYDLYSRVQVAGYAHHNLCVVYYIRPRTYTLSVIAHEGMHQYLASRFEGRIPAWLNEGLACYCEGFDLALSTPLFKPTQNATRRNALRTILSSNALMPMGELLAANAGSVILESHGRQTQAFYAQAWALVVFLRHGSEGQYRAGFEELLAGIASGELGTRAQAARLGSNAPAKTSFGEAVLRAYITDDIDRLETELHEYMVQLVGF